MSTHITSGMPVHKAKLGAKSTTNFSASLETIQPPANMRKSTANACDIGYATYRRYIERLHDMGQKNDALQLNNCCRRRYKESNKIDALVRSHPKIKGGYAAFPRTSAKKQPGRLFFRKTHEPEWHPES